MKKLSLLLLTAALLVGMASCTGGGGETTTAGTTTESATTSSVNETPGTTPSSDPGEGFVTDLTKLAPIADSATAETKTLTNFSGSYTVVTTDEVWSANTGIDYEGKYYTGEGEYYVGSGDDIVSYMDSNEFRAQYYVLQSDGSYSRVPDTEQIKALGGVIGYYSKATGSAAYKVYLEQVETRTAVQVTSVEAASGTYLLLDYVSNLPVSYKATISTRKNATTGINDSLAFKAEKVTDENGLTYYKGHIKITVPYTDEGDYYISVYEAVNTRNNIANIPLKITKGTYSDAEFHLLFAGDWDKVTANGYGEQLIDLFYNTYPRLIARWDTAGKATRTVTFIADSDYDAVAYSVGTTVVVSVDYANGHPTDIGFFSHEITHQVQQYSGFSSHFWTENMANYGGHRYFHWANANGKYVQFYSPTDAAIQDWRENDSNGNLSYAPYGDGSKWFGSFMDWMYPTTMNEDGTLKLGLIDTINYAIQHGQLKTDAGPDDPNSAICKLVQQATNNEFQTYEALRLYYVEQLNLYAATDGAEGWSFIGFADYTDNFITEDLPFTENPNYPMLRQVERGTVTAPVLDTPVTEGDNLLTGATVVRDSGIEGTSTAGKLIDGKVNTLWSGKKSTLGDATCLLNGTAGYIVIDLGEAKTFNTYTLYHATSKNPAGTNTTDWELLVSDDGTNWTSVDTQSGMGQNSIESFTFESTTARYVMLRIYPLANDVPNFSFYEMLLLNI
ncbi:MAG: discoidin domain-containing protein [Eubacteriales bacterium]